MEQLNDYSVAYGINVSAWLYNQRGRHCKWASRGCQFISFCVFLFVLLFLRLAGCMLPSESKYVCMYESR